jgi:hypothetical protein
MEAVRAGGLQVAVADVKHDPPATGLAAEEVIQGLTQGRDRPG